MRLYPRVLWFLGFFTATALIAFPGFSQPSGLQKEGRIGRNVARRTPVVDAVERVKAAVVNIHSERTIQNNSPVDFPASHSRVNGMGTGIVIDPRGYIVTNQHVVEDVSVLRIGLADGTNVSAMIVARNPELDLALLKIEAPKPLQTMPMGTASDLMIGETVIAIGNAYGYAHTVSVGVVSAIKRDVRLNQDLSYKSLIQTDASINPGNSGGPLINIHGELVGVNVAIRAGAQGIGFAIPADHMIKAVADMLRLRRRGFNYDGLVYRDLLEPSGDGLHRKVAVDRVDTGSPAAQAGLRPGDFILQVGDTPIDCSFDVERALLERKSGESVTLLVRRQDQEKGLTLALATAARANASSSPNDLIWAKLGMRLTPLPSDQVTRINRQLHGGLEVAAVQADGAAAKAGIRKGDILVGLHQWETLTLDNVVYVLSHPDLATFQPLSFYIVRASQVRRGWLGQIQ